jgi:rsbT co-antagonist protein RsbR
MDGEMYEMRLVELVEVISGMAGLDFSKKAMVDDSDDPLNSIAIGLNMLSEELEDSVVSKSELVGKNKQLEELAAQQNMMIAQMSTPISRLWEGILLLPLVGMMTVGRVKDVLKNILESISESQAKVFILDISGVSVIDTFTANHFVKIAKATRLMGCVCILSGITPQAAQTMVELGINTEDVETTGTMKDAIELSFSYTGFELSKKQNK